MNVGSTVRDLRAALGGTGGETLECVLPARGFGSAADLDCWPNRVPVRGDGSGDLATGHHAPRAQSWDISGYVYLTG
jgi:hypothetical protein